MRIYTRTGDDGTTGTLGEGRVGKGSLLIEVLGDLDELNACLGVVAAFFETGSQHRVRLESIQSRLFDIGAELASQPGDERFLAEGLSQETVEFEQGIDLMEGQLPALRAFILPGGSEPSAFAHLARTVCRRGERSVIKLSLEREVRPELSAWLNRLSDWLFVFARTVNAESGNVDSEWRKQ